MFAYQFMRNAFIVAIFVSVAATCIGHVVVLRRQANLGDALSHSALAGVALGVVMNINPTLGSLLGTLLAALVLEFLRRLFPRYQEISTAIVMALAVGLAAIFSSFAGSGQSFQSYLFGSIVAISDLERNLSIGISLVVILVTLLFNKEIFFINFDKNQARLSGVPISLVEGLFTLLIALTVGISSRSVGTLVISSLLVLPYASAMLWQKSYRGTLLLAIGLSILNSGLGITASYYLNLPPGGSIVVLSVLLLLLSAVISHIKHRPKAKA